jgi:hypothetical protein
MYLCDSVGGNLFSQLDSHSDCYLRALIEMKLDNGAAITPLAERLLPMSFTGRATNEQGSLSPGAEARRRLTSGPVPACPRRASAFIQRTRASCGRSNST